MAQGTPAQIEASEASLTGQYLSGEGSVAAVALSLAVSKAALPFDRAANLLAELVESEQFIEFLTLPGYARLGSE